MQIGKVFLLLWFMGVIIPNILADQEHDSEKATEADASRYIELQPAFVTNYGGGGDKILYLKADITLRITANGIDYVAHHMPLIRHELVMLLSKQSSQAVGNAEGKNQIRLSALEAVQRALAEEVPGNYIDDLLFTSFIVQR